jgi:hypothetical protein
MSACRQALRARTGDPRLAPSRESSQTREWSDGLIASWKAAVRTSLWQLFLLGSSSTRLPLVGRPERKRDSGELPLVCRRPPVMPSAQIVDHRAGATTRPTRVLQPWPSTRRRSGRRTAPSSRRQRQDPGRVNHKGTRRVEAAAGPSELRPRLLSRQSSPSPSEEAAAWPGWCVPSRWGSGRACHFRAPSGGRDAHTKQPRARAGSLFEQGLPTAPRFTCAFG